MSETTGPIALIAEFTTSEENLETVRGLIVAYGETVRAEPGNRAFQVYNHVAEPTKFWVHEIYADQAAFEAHIGDPAGKEFNGKLVPLINEPESVLTFLTPAN
ncbi:MAG: putative quinol monooxygenase [Tetrasphaera sp.]